MARISSMTTPASSRRSSSLSAAVRPAGASARHTTTVIKRIIRNLSKGTANPSGQTTRRRFRPQGTLRERQECGVLAAHHNSGPVSARLFRCEHRLYGAATSTSWRESVITSTPRGRARPVRLEHAASRERIDRRRRARRRAVEETFSASALGTRNVGDDTETFPVRPVIGFAHVPPYKHREAGGEPKGASGLAPPPVVSPTTLARISSPACRTRFFAARERAVARQYSTLGSPAYEEWRRPRLHKSGRAKMSPFLDPAIDKAIDMHLLAAAEEIADQISKICVPDATPLRRNINHQGRVFWSGATALSRPPERRRQRRASQNDFDVTDVTVEDVRPRQLPSARGGAGRGAAAEAPGAVTRRCLSLATARRFLRSALSECPGPSRLS